MRTPLLVAALTVVTLSAVACSDAETGTGTTNSTARRSAHKSATGGAPDPGTAQDHDDADTEGEHQVDPGNPNADTAPSAPATQGTSAPQFALALASTTPTVNLGEKVTLDVTVEPKNGFTGNVDLSVSGLPDGATAAPVTATVAQGAVTAAPVKLVIEAALTAVPSAPNASTPLVITGKSGAVQATANANFKIAPKFTLTIPVNIDALRAAGTQYRDEWGAPFGANQQALKTQTGNGIVVTVFNADSKAHIIHGANGFAHGSTTTPIQPNAFELSNGAPRTRTLNPGLNANGYPHDGQNGPGASFRIKVDAAN